MVASERRKTCLWLQASSYGRCRMLPAAPLSSYRASPSQKSPFIRAQPGLTLRHPIEEHHI